ncbi:MAG TPA: FtsX-like permease family protein [Cyclobacteriaceae bacterium]|nr:FtsX-like permease family protein [Cyclobacteriaceae bacterium]
MINNFKAAFRYLNRNRIATTINVTGLAVAMSAAFLMLQYLDFELSYDTYLPEHTEVYRIATQQSKNGVPERNTAEAYYGIADWITENLPDVEAATRVNRWPAATGFTIEANGKLFSEKRYLIADKEFFKVFPSLLVAGNPETCLAGLNSVIISEQLALKAFGTTDILGKDISNPGWKGHVFNITGIFRQTPANSHLDADIIHAYEWFPDPENEWVTTVWTYIRISKNADIVVLQEKLNHAVASMLPDPTVSANLTLQPLSSIHLKSNLEDEVKAPGSITNIYIVFGALILITLVAWINYVNLETARFIRRLKEVGIRRVVGSSKTNLFLKFFTEYVCLTSIALLVSVVITWIVFPYFGDVTGLQLSTPQFQVTELWTNAIIGLAIVAMLAGAYPFISVLRIHPVASLKGKVTEAVQGTVIRRSLVTFQLVASLTLMGLVVMASLQLEFMRSVKMNFNTSDILTVYNPANYTWLEDSLRKEKNEVFRNRLLQIPSVTNLTTSSAIPGEPIGFTYTDLAKRSMSDPDLQLHYKVMYIDYDFIPVFGLDLVEGRNYSREFSDEGCLVITESAVRALGFKSPQEALNQKIFFMEEDWDQWTIIGIVKDYRHQSIKTPAYPGIFRLHRNKGQMVYYSVKLEGGTDASKTVSTIESAWKETWPAKPFDYFFMDQHYDQQYKSEVHFSRVFTTFSAIAIFIACLGIMGMTLFEANSRTKEIGIRKILGAEVANIIMLLTKDSFKLLALSFAISVPLVYILSSKWLTEYPQHIRFSIWFVAAPLIIIGLLVAVVSLTQVLKAALKNPVESLKHQ